MKNKPFILAALAYILFYSCTKEPIVVVEKDNLLGGWSLKEIHFKDSVIKNSETLKPLVLSTYLYFNDRMGGQFK